MKLKTLFLLASIALLSIKLQAQNEPPKPIDNLFLKSISGAWSGQSELMGTKFNELLTCRTDYNGQYLIIDLRAADETKTHTYSGLGVFGLDESGNVTSWWFDDWGPASVSTGTGKIDGMTLTMDSQRPNVTVHRAFELIGKTLTMKWSVTSKDKDGKEDTMTGATT